MVLYYYCPTSRRWFCHSPTHHMATYEKLADRDKKVHQIWKLTCEVIEIKMQLQKRFQPIVSAEQWEWQLGHKFDACILVLLHSFLRILQVRFFQKGSKLLPKFTSENLKNKWLEDGCLAWITLVVEFSNGGCKT